MVTYNNFYDNNKSLNENEGAAMKEMVDIATDLGRQGYYVFPLTPNSKRPAIKGWQDKAACDSKAIKELWSGRFKNHLIGIATGKSGLVVVDVDNKKDKKGSEVLDLLELDHGQLPPTRIVKTPSGGLHYYFRGVCQSKNNGLGHGVDVKSDGGLVVAPGSFGYSVIHDTHIPIVPEWVKETVGIRKWEASDQTPKIAEDLIDSEYSINRAIQHLTEGLPPAIEGQSGDFMTYKTAAHLKGLGISFEKACELMIEYYNPRCEPPWEEDALMVKIQSGYTSAHEDGLGGGTPQGEFDEIEEEEKKRFTPTFKNYDNWVWIVQQYMFIHRQTKREYNKDQFNSIFDPRFVESKKTAFKALISHSNIQVRKLDSICYRPGAPEFIEWTPETQCNGQYNIWNNTMIKPIEGDASRFVEHVKYLCSGRERETELVLDYLAWMAQRPAEKLQHALIIQGPGGSGKSWLGHLMIKIIGKENSVEVTNKNLASDFNDWAKNKQLAVVHEIMAKGRYDTLNELKPLITEATVRINEKHVKPYDLENCINFLMFTNHDDALPIEADDRRYFVIMQRLPEKDAKYYSNLYDWMREKGAAIVCDFLKKRDISMYPGQSRAPKTDDKIEMARNTMLPARRFLIEQLEAKNPPFNRTLVTIDDVKEILDNNFNKVHNIDNIVRKFLLEDANAKQFKYDSGKCVWHRIGPKRVHFWCLDKYHIYKNIDQKERVKCYLKEENQSIANEFDQKYDVEIADLDQYRDQ